MTAIQFLAEWALRSSILIVSGALLLQALRVKDPSIRLAAWTAMLCGSLVIPALTAALPKLPLAVMRRASPRVEAPVAIQDDAPQPIRSASHPDVEMIQRGGSVSMPIDSVPAAPHSDVGMNRHGANAFKSFNWARAAVMIYVIVALVLLLRLCFGLMISLRLLHRSRVTGEATEGIEIRESDRVVSPVALGIVRPAIVMPGDWRSWDRARLDAVLAHERSHIRRHDPAVQLLSAIHRALLWHTPLSWFLHRQLVRVAEEVCDDAAVAVTHDRTLYAEVVLEFMRRGVWRANWEGVPMSRYDLAEMRIRRILDGTSLSHGVTRWSLAAILTLGLPLAYVIAAAYPKNAPPALATPFQTADQVSRNIPAPSRQWTPFKADMIERQYQAGNQGPVLLENYVYARRVDGSWVKSEPILPNGARVDQRIVEDYSTRTHTSIDASTKSLIKYHYSAKDVDYLSTPPSACGNSKAAHVEIQGYDTVEVKFTEPGPGEGFPVTEWRAPRLNCFAVKRVMVWGSSTLTREALDVKEGAPADSLFEIPSTYVELPSQGMAERAQRSPTELQKDQTESVRPLKPGVAGGLAAIPSMASEASTANVTPYLIRTEWYDYGKNPAGELRYLESFGRRSDGTTFQTHSLGPLSKGVEERAIYYMDGSSLALVDAIRSKTTYPSTSKDAAIKNRGKVLHPPPNCISPSEYADGVYRLGGNGSVLGHPALVVFRFPLINKMHVYRVTDWRAPDLGCAILQYRSEVGEPDGSYKLLAENKLVSLQMAEPDPRLFDPGHDYVELTHEEYDKKIHPLLVGQPPANDSLLVKPELAGGQDRIEGIIIRGNHRIPASTIRKSISINPGDIYDPAKIERDVTALRNTGYFDDVRAESSDDPSGTRGGTVIIFYVREKEDAATKPQPAPAQTAGKPPAFDALPAKPVVVGGAPAQTASAGSPSAKKEISPRIFTSFQPVTQVRPVYPPSAKKAGIQGKVRLRVTINKDGNLMEMIPLSGDPQLMRAALEAVQQWRYSPSEEVRVTVVTINFTLAKAGAATPPARVTAGHTLVSVLPSGAHPQSAPQTQAVSAPAAQSTKATAAPLPSFEVGSIKLYPSGSGGTRLIDPTGGTVQLSNGGTKGLIEMAYNVQAFQVSGGPSWIDSESYDIEAKIGDSVAEKMRMLTFEQRRQQLRLMIQSLLADRFKLRVSITTSELPVYALVIAKNGPKLHEADPGDMFINGTKGPDGYGPQGKMSIGSNYFTYQDATMAVLAEDLSRHFLGRTVLDQTGLKGKYDFTLHWTHDQNQGAMFKGQEGGNPGIDNAPSAEASGPSIFTALQEQLGLELKSIKGPVEILVIDHIERPSAN